MDGLKTHQISTENFLTKSTNSINSFRTIYILKPLISIFRLLYLIFYNLNLSAKKTFVNVNLNPNFFSENLLKLEMENLSLPSF